MDQNYMKRPDIPQRARERKKSSTKQRLFSILSTSGAYAKPQRTNPDPPFPPSSVQAQNSATKKTFRSDNYTKLGDLSTNERFSRFDANATSPSEFSNPAQTVTGSNDGITINYHTQNSQDSTNGLLNNGGTGYGIPGSTSGFYHQPSNPHSSQANNRITSKNDDLDSVSSYNQNSLSRSRNTRPPEYRTENKPVDVSVISQFMDSNPGYYDLMRIFGGPSVPFLQYKYPFVGGKRSVSSVRDSLQQNSHDNKIHDGNHRITTDMTGNGRNSVVCKDLWEET